MCEIERDRKRECVGKRKRARECVCERESDRECMRERERERECVCESEIEKESVCGRKKKREIERARDTTQPPNINPCVGGGYREEEGREGLEHFREQRVVQPPQLQSGGENQ